MKNKKRVTLKTIVINAKNIDKEAAFIRKNFLNQGLVIFPTETVYGIGANALDSKASKKIFKAKGRPSDNPLIVHIADKKDLNKYVTNQSLAAKKLIANFWPGPLTLIFNKKDVIPKTTSGGLNTVAVRLPSNKIAQKIIKIAGVPIAAPSANISGKPSSTKFEHVLNDFNGLVDIIVNGGDSKIGLESTVIDTSVNPPVLLRPGYITKPMIEKALGYQIKDKSILSAKDKVKSPGLKYQHYQPTGKVIILEGSALKMANYVNQKSKHSKKHIYVICESEYQKLFNVKTRAIGSAKSKKEQARNLFAALRDMDQFKADIIYVHHLGNKGIAEAIMNRLYKAASYRVIKL